MRTWRLCISLIAFAISTATAATTCMSVEDAQQVADNYLNLESTYNEFSITLAKAAIAPNLTQYTSSTNTLINSGCTSPINLDSPTFTSAKEFFAGQGSQPMQQMRILNLWNTCRASIVRWRIDLVPQTVTGIAILETTPATKGAPFPWLISTVYSDFDSASWLTDLKVFAPKCTNGTGRHATSIRRR